MYRRYVQSNRLTEQGSTSHYQHFQHYIYQSINQSFYYAEAARKRYLQKQHSTQHLDTYMYMHVYILQQLEYAVISYTH